METEPSNELLEDAITCANNALNFEPDETDLVSAREALLERETLGATPWAFIVVGYVTVAMRGGRQ